MNYSYHILSQLNKYKNKDRVRLHMPGHKNSGTFRGIFPIAPIDVTELSFSDDLSCPDDVIANAQADIAEILGAKKAYITTDGSTSGVLSMMYVAKKFGNKIIVPRNSHRSVFNACKALGLEPVIVQGVQSEDVLLPPDASMLETLIVNDVNISGMIIASPDYYGNIAPLSEYKQVLEKHGRLLFVDGAHGIHLAYEEDKQGYAGLYADMWVDGAHKTLPVLTQGAVVCVNNEKLLPRAEAALSIFRTTSPSYPIMASVEYGIKYYINNPKNAQRAKLAVQDMKEQLSSFVFYPSGDWTKLAVDFKALGVSPYLAESYLEKKGVYCEMNDGRYLLFYLSQAVEPAQINEVKGLLMQIAANKKLKNTYEDKKPLPTADRTYSFQYALRQKTEWVPLEKSVGRMCAENAGVTPPCLPVVIIGEMISKQAVEVLSSAKKTFGLDNKKIKVVKK